jgi:pyrroline-5-carboxylate reductase
MEETTMLKGTRIGFVGGGNMAEAIVKGLLAGGVPATDITLAEPVAQRREYLGATYAVKTVDDNGSAVETADIVILAVKPQVSATALRALPEASCTGKLFISIMAGVPTKSIENTLTKGARVVRVMPNTPALVLQAASAIAPGSSATAADMDLALEIFNLLGTACTVEEKLLDAVTGLSGSGPAYVFTFIEALSDAGVKNGLPRDKATLLAAQTVLGSARMVLETAEHTGILRDRVTSPGGTTIAGLHALEQAAFRAAIMNAVDVAAKRSEELGKA